MKSYLKHLLTFFVVFIICFSLFIFYDMYSLEPAERIEFYLSEMKDRIVVFIIPLSVSLAYLAAKRERKAA